MWWVPSTIDQMLISQLQPPLDLRFGFKNDCRSQVFSWQTNRIFHYCTAAENWFDDSCPPLVHTKWSGDCWMSLALLDVSHICSNINHYKSMGFILHDPFPMNFDPDFGMIWRCYIDRTWKYKNGFSSQKRHMVSHMFSRWCWTIFGRLKISVVNSPLKSFTFGNCTAFGLSH